MAAAGRHRGTDLAVGILRILCDAEGEASVADLVAALGVSRSTLHRITRTLAAAGLLDLARRGVVRVGPLGLKLAGSREADLLREDESRLAPRPKRLVRAPGTSYALVRNRQTTDVQSPAVPWRRPKYRLAFSNAAIDSPWRVALVHSVEYAAVKYRPLISSLAIRHAGQDARRQAADIEAFIAAGIDGLILSAHDSRGVEEVVAETERRGIPTVLVDRGLPDVLPNASFVTCDDDAIGRITARWMAEYLEGRGRLLLMPGLAAAEPAQRRLAEARRVFAQYPDIQILATRWTSWQHQVGREIARRAIADHGGRIDGVWCDSGLQAVGALEAFIETGGLIPPHTGGDLNRSYKLAIRHQVPLAAVDYPPAMGLRAVELLLDVLRGRSVPKRVDVATEIVVTRGCATPSVQPDLWADEHVRWDLPDDLILASGLGPSYDPRSFRVHYKGNRYNRSAAARPDMAAPHGE